MCVCIDVKQTSLQYRWINTFRAYFTYYCSQFRLIDLLRFVCSMQSTWSQNDPDTILDPSINNTEKWIFAQYIYLTWRKLLSPNISNKSNVLNMVCVCFANATEVILPNKMVITVTSQKAFIMIVNLTIWTQWISGPLFLWIKWLNGKFRIKKCSILWANIIYILRLTIGI